MLALAVVACGGTRTGGSDPARVAAQGVRAVGAKDWSALARLAHPTLGIRFSPYAYVDTTTGVVLSASEVAALGNDSGVRLWGRYDGSGEPINLAFPAYFARFVYDRDFAQVAPGPPDVRLGKGNSTDNILAVYSPRRVMFFEYHVPGTERYNGMDWGSLRLVLEQVEERWYLIALVHDEWTI
ncbi:MAG: hypothetical protein ABI877_07275 [Gemmatimonadaceae bacterium]